MVGWYGMHICMYALPHCTPVFAMLGCRRVEHAIRINYWWFKNVFHCSFPLLCVVFVGSALADINVPCAPWFNVQCSVLSLLSWPAPVILVPHAAGCTPHARTLHGQEVWRVWSVGLIRAAILMCSEQLSHHSLKLANLCSVGVMCQVSRRRCRPVAVAPCIVYCPPRAEEGLFNSVISGVWCLVQCTCAAGRGQNRL